MSSRRSARLSASAHWKSSTTSTTGWRAVSRANISRRPANTRARCSVGSTAFRVAGRAARATTSHRRRTGKTSATGLMCIGISMAASTVDSSTRCLLRLSATPSNAL